MSVVTGLLPASAIGNGINRTKFAFQAFYSSKGRTSDQVKLIRKYIKMMKSEKALMFLHKYNLVLVASATKQVLKVPAAHLMDL